MQLQSLTAVVVYSSNTGSISAYVQLQTCESIPGSVGGCSVTVHVVDPNPSQYYVLHEQRFGEHLV